MEHCPRALPHTCSSSSRQVDVVVLVDELGLGEPAVLLLHNHLLQAARLLLLAGEGEGREDEEDVLDVRLEIGEGAVELRGDQLAGVEVEVDPRDDRLTRFPVSPIPGVWLAKTTGHQLHAG